MGQRAVSLLSSLLTIIPLATGGIEAQLPVPTVLRLLQQPLTLVLVLVSGPSTITTFSLLPQSNPWEDKAGFARLPSHLHWLPCHECFLAGSPPRTTSPIYVFLYLLQQTAYSSMHISVRVSLGELGLAWLLGDSVHGGRSVLTHSYRPTPQNFR